MDSADTQVPEPVAPGRRKLRRMAPWIIGGILVAAGLSCMGLVGVGSWAAKRAYDTAKAAQLNLMATMCHIEVSNQHAEAVTAIRIHAVRDGELGELLAEHHGLHPGTSTMFALDTSLPPYSVRLQYDGPDGRVVLDDVVTVDGNSMGTTTVRLGVQDEVR